MAVVAALTLDMVAIALDLARLRRLRGGETLATVGLDVASELSDAANLLIPASVLVAAAGFGWWFSCSYRRLDRLGLAERKPVWAIAGWLVPGLNLVRPPVLMEELATAGAPRSSEGGRPGTDRNLIIGWWVLWLAGAAGQVGLRLISPSSNHGWSIWFWLALVADVLLIGGLWCALVLVSDVDHRLGALRAVHRGRQRGDPAPPVDPVAVSS